MVGAVGFEPTQPKATDLQSAATLQLRRTPKYKMLKNKNGCGRENRTPDEKLMRLPPYHLAIPRFDVLIIL